MGPGAEFFLLLCVHYIPLLMHFNIKLSRKRNICREGRRGGGGGDKLVLGLGEIPGLPPKMKPWCVWTPLLLLLLFLVG